MKNIHKIARKERIIIKKGKMSVLWRSFKMYVSTIILVLLLNSLLSAFIICLHSKLCEKIFDESGFGANTILISAAFTLFGFAITAKNILNYKHSDYFANIPIKTIVEKSSTKLYYIYFYNIIVTPIFMLCLFCYKDNVNLTPYIFFSFICFVLYLRKTYMVINFKNIQDIISDVLLELTLQYNNFEIIDKRKNLLSSLFTENLKNVSALDYVPIFNEYLKKSITLLDGTYINKPKSIIKKEIKKRYNKRNGKKYIKQNIAVVLYEYLNFSYIGLTNLTGPSNEKFNNLSYFAENIKEIIDFLFKVSKNKKENEDLYKYYINAFIGLLIATLKNTDIKVYDEICKYLKTKFTSNNTNCVLQEIYYRNHFNILVVLTLDYCIINNYISRDTNVLSLNEFYNDYFTPCSDFTLTSVKKYIYNEYKIGSMDVSIKDIIEKLDERLHQFNKYPLYLDYKKEGYKDE